MKFVFILLLINILEPVFGNRGFQQLAMSRFLADQNNEQSPLHAAMNPRARLSKARPLAKRRKILKERESMGEGMTVAEPIKVKPLAERKKLRKEGKPSRLSELNTSPLPAGPTGSASGMGLGGGFGAGMSKHGATNPYAAMGAMGGAGAAAGGNSLMSLLAASSMMPNPYAQQLDPMSMLAAGQMGQMGQMNDPMLQLAYISQMQNPMMGAHMGGQMGGGGQMSFGEQQRMAKYNQMAQMAQMDQMSQMGLMSQMGQMGQMGMMGSQNPYGMQNPAAAGMMGGMFNPMAVNSQIVAPGAAGGNQKKRFLQNRKFELHDLEKLKKEAAAKSSSQDEAHSHHEEDEEEEEMIQVPVAKKATNKPSGNAVRGAGNKAGSVKSKTQNLMLMIDRPVQMEAEEIDYSQAEE